MFSKIVAILAAMWPLVGPLGTVLEAIGEKFNYPLLVAFGQRLEAISVDVPKAIRGSRFTNASVADIAKKVSQE